MPWDLRASSCTSEGILVFLVLEATYQVELRALERVSSVQKALEGSDIVKRELLEGSEEHNIPPTIGIIELPSSRHVNDFLSKAN